MTGELFPPTESISVTPEPTSESVSAQAEGVTPSTQPDESTPELAEEPKLEQNEDLDGQSSFAEALSAFEHEHSHRSESRQLQGTVVSLSADQVILDIGYKMEGVLPRSAFETTPSPSSPATRSPSPSPAATRRATTSSRASAWRSPATGPASSAPSRRKSLSPAL
jgi:hypothetical protein